MRRSLGAVIAGVLALGALAGCSHPRSSKVDTPAPSPSAQPSTPPASAYVESPPSGPATTAPGTGFRYGDSAVVAWKPHAGAAATLLDITVSGATRSDFGDKAWRGWNVAKKTKSYTPYFVRATVTNAGTTSLDGLDTPLYALDNASQLLQASSFKAAFKPCGPSTFPPHFGPGETAKVCLVYLVPPKANFIGVSYRPDESLEPITWKGPFKG